MRNNGNEAGNVKNCQNVVAKIFHNAVYDNIEHTYITEQAEEHNRE